LYSGVIRRTTIDAVYPAVFQHYHNLNWLREGIILAAKNEDVHKIMNQILAMLSGVVTEYKSIDNIVDADEVVNFPPKFLNSLDPAGLPPHHLLLKWDLQLFYYGTSTRQNFATAQGCV
jgi:hypothetical protein